MPTFWKRDLLLGKHFDFVSHNVNASGTIIQVTYDQLGEITQWILFGRHSGSRAPLLPIPVLFVSVPSSVIVVKLCW